MSPELTALTQATIDFLGWFLVPFAVFVVVEWLAGLFRNGY